MARRRPETDHDRGQAAVELALAFPLVVVFLLAAIQVAVVVRDQLAVIHAAREAARAAAVSSDPGDGAAAGREAVTLPGLDVSIRAGGSTVRAEVSRRVPTDVPIVGAFLPDLTVRAHAVMAVEP